jgi:hypothetical protein
MTTDVPAPTPTPTDVWVFGMNHSFRDPELERQFEIQLPREGRKIAVVRCHHCPWTRSIHAARMKRHLKECEGYKRYQMGGNRYRSEHVHILAGPGWCEI